MFKPVTEAFVIVLAKLSPATADHIRRCLSSPFKQGPTRHRTMAHRILNISHTVYCLFILSTIYCLLSIIYCLLCEFKCLLLYYSTPVADLEDMFVLVCSINLLVSDLQTGWPHDHGPNNVGAMVKRIFTRTLVFRPIHGLGVTPVTYRCTN